MSGPDTPLVIQFSSVDPLLEYTAPPPPYIGEDGLAPM